MGSLWPLLPKCQVVHTPQHVPEKLGLVGQTKRKQKSVAECHEMGLRTFSYSLPPADTRASTYQSPKCNTTTTSVRVSGPRKDR
eukprot:609883-Amphidinium_carterae.1